MLEKLTIRDFAIIEDITVSFHEGMNVITGETGAGKSLIIDTISLLGGARSDKDLIRNGKDTAYIRGEFKISNLKLLDYLEDNLLADANNLVIEREIKENKSVAKVNSKTVNLETLRAISYYLMDIHVQHDLYRLMDEANYFNYLDDYADFEISELKNKYMISRDKYLEAYKQYKDLLTSQRASADRLEFLTYELAELEAFNLKEDEDLILEQEITKLKNYDKIFNSLKDSYSYLENEGFSLDSIYDSASALNKILDLDPKYAEINKNITDSYYLLDEAKSELYNLLSNSEFDSEEFDALQERSYSLTNLKEKYHKSLAELITYRDSLKFEIERITNFDGLVLELKNKLINLGTKAYNDGIKLSSFRKKIALALEKEIIKECQDLDLKDVDFKIDFKPILDFDYDNPAIFNPNGLDQIDFLVSFNKGEAKRSLQKVASGGELSRVMLAFKTIFASKRSLSLIVFDEIDTGVSGEAALMIAKKIKAISKEVMVISITHMPQVSAISDHNYYVYKEEENARTKAHIKELDEDEKIYKLAQMLSGRNITSSGLNHARELINLTKKL